MLKIPEIGFRRSVAKSNVDKIVSADWIEASILFDDPEFSVGDMVDVLIESQICSGEDQDLAHQIAEEAWRELTLRKTWRGIPPSVSISDTRVSTTQSWEDDVLRSFLVLLSLLRIYPEWAEAHKDHVTQGNLFEKVVEVVCPALLPGWSIYRAGWSPDNTKRIPEIVEELCARLFTRGAVDLDAWVGPADNDGGLDIVCYRSFGDSREAGPVFFLQCASGKNWRDKVKTPDPNAWAKYLNTAVQPSTGIVAPFVITDFELRRAGLVGQTVVFDRIRILSAAQERGITLEGGLLDEVREWMRPRVQQLPRS